MVDDAAFASALAEQSSDALVALSPEGLVLFWNQGAALLFGFSGEEALGRSLHALIVPPEGRDEAQAAFDETLARGAAVFESARVRKNGTRLDVSVSMRRVRSDDGELRFVGVIHRDLTVLKRLGEAQSAEEKFRRLLEAAPDAMVIADAWGRIQLVNARTESLFGYSRGDLLGEPVEILIPERYRSAHPAHRGRYFAEPRNRPMGSGGLALFGRKKDGSEIPVEISLSPFATEDGIVAITAIRDVTDRRRAEEERAKLNQAQEAIRMRDDFLSIASHELKTPLSSMQLRVQNILRQAGASSPTATIEVTKLQSIQGAIGRLTKLVNQLLDVSRITANRLELRNEDVDLAAIVRDVSGQFREELERSGCELRMDIGEPIFVSCDRLRIEQVVTNLLSNASKYGGGKPVEVTLTRAGDRAELTIRDHGIGIVREHQARIFDRFERVVSERNYGGFGLGLWIVRQILDAQGGSIRVWSEPGAGSAFTVSLALSAAAMERAAPQHVDVLVVDDDASMRDAMTEILEHEGYVVECAANGRDALACLHRGVVPRIVLLDLMMPFMDAAAFRAEQLRDAALSRIPVVIVSASAKIATETESLRASGYLCKPVELEELLRMVRLNATAANDSLSA